MSCCEISRRAALLGGLATLAGCGFRPLHGAGSPVTALRGKISITTPRSVIGYRIAEQLELRLGSPNAAQYDLLTDIDLRETTSIVTETQETQRFSLIGSAPWRLVSRAEGRLRAEGKARAVVSYSASGSTVATETARRDAETRLGVMLADQITDQIALALIAPPPA